MYPVVVLLQMVDRDQTGVMGLTPLCRSSGNCLNGKTAV